jgi:hypothetical protein
MSGQPRCERTVAIVEHLLAGDPPTAEERAHLATCAACARAAARVPAFEARIARAAAELSTGGPIPSGVLDHGVVDPPVAEAPRGRVMRLGLLGGAVAAAALVTAIGLGLLRPAPGPSVTSPDLSVEGIVSRLTVTGITCEAKTLDKLASPPLVGQYCAVPKGPSDAKVERLASVYLSAQGETWVEAKASVADRHDDAQVAAASTFLLDAARAAVTNPDDQARLTASMAEMFADRLLPRDVRMELGNRVVFLQGSWSQGWQLRIGPA